MRSGPAYDAIGRGYARYRRPDPAITAMLADALGDAEAVVSVGSGAGSYEPAGGTVIAIEPSMVMIRQRPANAAPAIRAVAESLPLRSGTFDAALAVLTIHHWSDLQLGLSEMRRVARRQIVLTFDPTAHCAYWLTDYIPEVADVFRAAPAIDTVANAIGATDIRIVPLAHDTPDGMTVAYWRRPEAYLDPARRAGASALQMIDPLALQRGLKHLETDLTSGAWHARYGTLLSIETMDYGLRILSN